MRPAERTLTVAETLAEFGDLLPLELFEIVAHTADGPWSRTSTSEPAAPVTDHRPPTTDNHIRYARRTTTPAQTAPAQTVPPADRAVR